MGGKRGCLGVEGGRDWGGRGGIGVWSGQGRGLRSRFRTWGGEHGVSLNHSMDRVRWSTRDAFVRFGFGTGKSGSNGTDTG